MVILDLCSAGENAEEGGMKKLSVGAALAALALSLAAAAAQRAAPGRGERVFNPPSLEGRTASSELMTTHVPLADRIAHTDPSRYNHLPAVHNGSGPMDYMALYDGRRADKFHLGSNLLFLHRGVLPPGGGIGEHFHNTTEEMFVILDGEAEFTIDGRTSVLKGPAGAPARLGHAHGITNQSKQTVQWMNINVSTIPGYYDAFNLDDGRVGAAKDATPQFVSMHLDRALLQPWPNLDGGQGVAMYRRALDASVFASAWSYVDHILLPPGASLGPVSRKGMSEVYYVMKGEGAAAIGGETASIKEGDAVPAAIDESRAFRNTGREPLELMVLGIAKDIPTKLAYMVTADNLKRTGPR
jgi:mannose-6-phosphate isomerase-like protein (cupin superfamily)